jgi:hypothetical protein
LTPDGNNGKDQNILKSPPPLLWSSIPSACKTSAFWSVFMGHRSTLGIS